MAGASPYRVAYWSMEGEHVISDVVMTAPQQEAVRALLIWLTDHHTLDTFEINEAPEPMPLREFVASLKTEFNTEFMEGQPSSKGGPRPLPS